MKNLLWKTILLAAGFLVLHSADLAAQGYGGRGKGQGKGRGAEGRPMLTPEERATRHTNRMNDELKLTPDQKTKIYAINLKYIQKRDAARAQTERGPERRGQMVDNFKAQDAEIEALLTPEQKATFKARKEQMREGMQERRQGHRGGGRGGK